VRRDSDLLARFGGEEFVLLLPRTDRAGAMMLGERIRAAVAAARPKGIAVTLSVGAATLGGAVHTGPELLLAADRALYRSKARGRNAVTHADELPALDLTPMGELARGEASEA
jgi:diguanylate cyclase (GGDEF)-like protein